MIGTDKYTPEDRRKEEEALARSRIIFSLVNEMLAGKIDDPQAAAKKIGLTTNEVNDKVRFYTGEGLLDEPQVIAARLGGRDLTPSEIDYMVFSQALGGQISGVKKAAEMGGRKPTASEIDILVEVFVKGCSVGEAQEAAKSGERDLTPSEIDYMVDVNITRCCFDEIKKALKSGGRKLTHNEIARMKKNNSFSTWITLGGGSYS